MNKIKEIILIICSTVILFVFVELSIRVVYKGQEPPLPVDTSKFAFEFHPEYLLQLKKNMKKVFQHYASNGGKVINWTTNKFRMRGAEPKDSSDLRLMVYGDSNIMGRFSNWDNSFCGKLDSALTHSTGLTVDVLNCGVVGFGPDQILLKMSKEAAKYQPDAIILSLFADNDHGDIIRNRLYELDDKGQLIRTTYVAQNDIYNPFLPKPKPFFRTVELLNAIKNKYAPVKESKDLSVAETLDLYMEKCELEYEVYKDGDERVFSPFDDHYDIDFAAFPDLPSSLEKSKLMGALLFEFKRLSESIETPIFVLILPSVMDVSVNFKIDSTDLSIFKHYNPSRLSSDIEKSSQKAGLNSLNLFPIFLNNNPDSLYLKSPDNHWNDAGQNLAALKMAEIVKSRIADSLHARN